jgi:hypothetical protein
MENILVKNDFNKITPNYYYNEFIGPILVVNDSFILFDPISSFENSTIINSFFDDLLYQSKLNNENCVVVFDKSSLSDDDKKLYPDFKFNINDPTNEKLFVDFYTTNQHFIQLNKKFENLISFVDFDTNIYSLGTLNLETNGSALVNKVFDSNKYFSLDELKKQFDPTIFTEANFLEIDEKSSFYDQMEVHFNNAKNGDFFYTVELDLDEKLFQSFTFYNYNGLESLISEGYYDENDDTDVFVKTIIALPSGNSFALDPLNIHTIKNDIKKLKVKNLFKV